MVKLGLVLRFLKMEKVLKCFVNFALWLSSYMIFLLRIPLLVEGYIVCTPPPPWVMGWGLSHFSYDLYWRDLNQIRILGGNWHFRLGWFFQVGLENSCSKKLVNTNIKQKNDSDCNFYNFSLLIPSCNRFLVVCIFIFVLHGLYSPYPQIFFFVGGGLIILMYLVARSLEDFKVLGNLLFWGDLLSFLIEGG